MIFFTVIGVVTVWLIAFGTGWECAHMLANRHALARGLMAHWVMYVNVRQEYAQA